MLENVRFYLMKELTSDNFRDDTAVLAGNHHGFSQSAADFSVRDTENDATFLVCLWEISLQEQL